ncbi:MAG: class I SAM-dependent methyltransferase [Pseudomonadota bacterium]
MTRTATEQLKTESRFWDRIAPRYSRKPVPDAAVYEQKLERTERYLNADQVVLEVGCGTGTTAIHHASSVRHVHATDLSTGMIQIAQEKADAAGVQNITFEVSSISELDTKPDQYDVILAHSILHLVSDVPRTLRQFRQMLKPGGVLIASTPCLADIAGWLRWIAPVGNALGLLPALNFFSKDQYFKWMEQAGFSVEENWLPGAKTGYYTVSRSRREVSGRSDEVVRLVG